MKHNNITGPLSLSKTIETLKKSGQAKSRKRPLRRPLRHNTNVDKLKTYCMTPRKKPTVSAFDVKLFQRYAPYERWSDRINQSTDRRTLVMIEMGNELLSAYQSLTLEDWRAMFINKQVKISLSTAYMLVRICRNTALVEKSNCIYLPCSIRTLLTLSKLSPNAVQAGIDDGRINPCMTWWEANSMLMNEPF